MEQATEHPNKMGRFIKPPVTPEQQRETQKNRKKYLKRKTRLNKARKSTTSPISHNAPRQARLKRLSEW